MNPALLTYEERNRFHSSWPWWRWVMTSLSALALALSSYLGWHYLVGGPVIGCGGGSPCDQVLNSRWSAIGGVLPVSGVAAGAYLAMLVSIFSLGPTTEAPVRQLAWNVMLVLSGAIVGSAVWFMVVQKWFVGAFCPYCMATHITGILLAVLVIWRASRQRGDHSTDGALAPPASTATKTAARAKSTMPARGFSPGTPWPSTNRALIGVALAGLLVAGQLGLAPRTAYRDGTSQDTVAALDPHAVPLVGSPEAPHVVTLLFDYKCPHCQQLHLMLDAAIRRYDGQLAFALCPAPLNTQCNPYVARDTDEFKDSCELAKIGLAVWVANREAFAVFDRWMSSFESGDRWHPRSLDAAKAKAIELIGPVNFEAAAADPWIDRYMQTCIRIYGGTIENGAGGVPKLVFGSRWVSPEPYSADDLVSILQNGLGVPLP